MVFVDYKKAFDMVDHATLLSKLEAYNLDKNALLWFKSYSIGFIHGTVIVHWDRNSRCATGFHVGNPCFLLYYQWSTLTCPFSGRHICWLHHSSGGFRFCFFVWCICCGSILSLIQVLFPFFLGGGGMVLLFVMYDNEFKTIKGNKI